MAQSAKKRVVVKTSDNIGYLPLNLLKQSWNELKIRCDNNEAIGTPDNPIELVDFELRIVACILMWAEYKDNLMVVDNETNETNFFYDHLQLTSAQLCNIIKLARYLNNENARIDACRAMTKAIENCETREKMRRFLNIENDFPDEVSDDFPQSQRSPSTQPPVQDLNVDMGNVCLSKLASFFFISIMSIIQSNFIFIYILLL